MGNLQYEIMTAKYELAGKRKGSTSVQMDVRIHGERAGKIRKVDSRPE